MSDQRGNFNQGRPTGAGNYQSYRSMNNSSFNERPYGQGYQSQRQASSSNTQGGAPEYQRQYSRGPQEQDNDNFANNSNGPTNRSQGPNVVNVPWDQYELRKKPKHGSVCKFFLTLGSWITFARNFVFNALFLLMLFVIFGGYLAVKSLSENGISLSSSSIETIDMQANASQVLYFDLSGPISEMPFSSNSLDSLQRELETALYGHQSHELVAIEKALQLVATDKSIKKVILSLDNMGPINLSMAERIGFAMEEAKAKDKRSQDENFEREVVVVGYGFNQAGYAIAAHADKIVMDSLGEIDFKGIAMSSLYFKDMLDKANITPYIFRAGHFKSAVEPFMLNGMSYDVRREYQALAFKSWDLYKQAISYRSQTTKTNILPDAATYVQWINSTGGSRAQLQLSQGLVDNIMPLDNYYQNLTAEVNADFATPYRPAIITYQDYLLRHNMKNGGSAKVGALSQIEVNAAPNLISKVDQSNVTQAAFDSARSLLGVALNSTLTASSNLYANDQEPNDNYYIAPENSSNEAVANEEHQVTQENIVYPSSPAPASNTPSRQEPVGNNYNVHNLERANSTVANNMALDNTKGQSLGSKIKERRAAQGNKISHKSGTIAVVYGIGEIVDVGEKPTDFTPDNIIPVIEDVQNDPNVNAVVLYLNSPGGSVIASERIRRSIETFQKYSSKPLIVSMNGTAASGAYWIASQAEKLYATPSTITGSIGVFGLSFGAHKLLNKYGAYQDGVVTNELALTAIAKEMPYTQQTIYNLSVEKTYKDFIELVAKNRGLKANDYEIFAEGQVFLADDALAIGLIDAVGRLDDAILYAAEQANINPKGIKVVHKAPGSGSNMNIFDSMLFSFSQAYLPKEFTYSLVQMRKVSKMAGQERPSIMALSPLTEPNL